MTNPLKTARREFQAHAKANAEGYYFGETFMVSKLGFSARRMETVRVLQSLIGHVYPDPALSKAPRRLVLDTITRIRAIPR